VKDTGETPVLLRSAESSRIEPVNRSSRREEALAQFRVPDSALRI